ncbi:MULTISPECIES: hypothetical protein, partial [unclassified Aeromonas]|uniref:hypothetical protein n=3 Tax=Aeromonas TaxID=642 RepID=UPI0022E46B70
GVFGDSQFTSTLSVNFHFPKIPRRTKKKPTAQAVGKDNSGWMFTDSERVCRPVGKKQRTRREASESVHLIELNERKLVVTDGLGNKLFHH